MKKVCIIVGYWLAAILLTTLLLLSLDYDLWVAVMMSLTFLPSAMALSFFLPKVSRTKPRSQRVLDSVYIIFGVMTTAFLLIYVTQFLTDTSIGPTGFPEWDLPSMLGNPVFVAMGITASRDGWKSASPRTAPSFSPPITIKFL